MSVSIFLTNTAPAGIMFTKKGQKHLIYLYMLTAYIVAAMIHILILPPDFFILMSMLSVQKFVHQLT